MNYRQQLPHLTMSSILDTLDDYDAFQPIGQPMVKPQFSLNFADPSSKIRSALYGNQTNNPGQQRFFDSSDL